MNREIPDSLRESHVVRALASSANSPSLATTNCLPGDTWRVSFGRWANPCGSLKVLGNSPGIGHGIMAEMPVFIGALTLSGPSLGRDSKVEHRDP